MLTIKQVLVGNANFILSTRIAILYKKLLFISFYKTKTYSTVVIKIWWIDVSLNYKVSDKDSVLFTATVHCIHASSTYILYIQGCRFIQQLWWYSISVVVFFFFFILLVFSLYFYYVLFFVSILYLRVDNWEFGRKITFNLKKKHCLNFSYVF